MSAPASARERCVANASGTTTAIAAASARSALCERYPAMEAGRAGTGATHHFAFAVASAEEQLAWRDYLRGRGVPCTDVFDRNGIRSIYVRDPDGHIVEIATSGPGFPAGGPSA